MDHKPKAKPQKHFRFNVHHEFGETRVRRNILSLGSFFGFLVMAGVTLLHIRAHVESIFIAQDFFVLLTFGLSAYLSTRLKSFVWIARFVTLVLFFTFIANVLTDDLNNIGILWAFLFPSIVFMFFSSREALVWSSLYVAVFVALSAQSLSGASNVGDDVSVLTSATAVVALLAVINYIRQRRIEQSSNALLVEDRKALAQKEELQKFKLAADSAYDHIIISDPDGIILYANAAAARITGYSQEEILGTKAGKKWSLPMPPAFYDQLWKTIKVEKKVFSGELQNRRKNGQVYDALASISPILNEQGEVLYFVGIERDITREKQVDRAKTEFVSLASHQLRTPLSAINWYTEMLLNGDAGKINAEQKEYLQEVYHGSQRMVALVNALLNVSRIDLGTFAIDLQPTRIQDVAAVALKELEKTVKEKQLSLVVDIAQEIPELQLDPKLTLIIFQNLLSNAVKYTPLNGIVTLRVTQEKKGILITVEDTGYGIAKQDFPRVFQKLFRADNVREKVPDGTGLGLYIVKSILEQSGGSISFTSELGKGTSFHAILPTSGMRSKIGTKALTP